MELLRENDAAYQEYFKGAYERMNRYDFPEGEISINIMILMRILGKFDLYIWHCK